MPKLFDKLFASRVKLVFENHEESYNPSDWEKMRAKLGHKEKKRAIYIFPWIAKAAAITMFVGFPVINDNQKLDSDKGNGHRRNIAYTESEPAIRENMAEDEALIAEKHRTYAKTRTLIEKDDIANNNLLKNKPLTNVEFQENETVLAVDSSKMMFVDLSVPEKHNEENQNLTISVKKDSTIKQLPELADEDLINDVAEDKKHFEFGVELASISSYSANANSVNTNISGGFSAGYRFTKNLSLSTGMLIAKQSLEYDNTDGINASKLNSINADGNALNIINTTSTKSDLSFVSLDIPVNIKYRYNHFVFTAGVSSLVLINEKYSKSYDKVINSMSYNSLTAEYETSRSTQNIVEEETDETFNHVDIAGLLNISVAYDIPLNKGSIAFEPYMKLPLANISSQDIRMGAGGIALRYCF